MNTETLEEKLHKRADKKLKEEIEASFRSARDAISRYGIYSRNIHDSGVPLQVNQTADGSKYKLVEAWKALSLLATDCYEVSKENYRIREVNDFLGEVERLGQEVEELRNSLST